MGVAVALPPGPEALAVPLVTPVLGPPDPPVPMAVPGAGTLMMPVGRMLGAVGEGVVGVLASERELALGLGMGVQLGRVNVPLKFPELPCTMQFFEHAASPLLSLVSQHGE